MALRQAANRAIPGLRSTLNTTQVRNMGGHGGSIEEEIKQMNKWKKISIAALPVLVATTAYMFSKPHGHGEESPGFAYLRMRRKEFPWGANGLFEFEKEH